MRIGFSGSPAAVWDASAAWWRGHGLPFPEPPGAVEPAGSWEAHDGVMAFPGLSFQQAQRDGLADLASYGGPAVVSAELLGAEVDRPDAPYFLVLDATMPSWSRGLTAPRLRGVLGEHGRVGLSVLEYLVVQRHAFEVFGDHRFDDYTGDPAGWTWLPASTSGPLHAMAYYYEKPDRVEIAACKAGSKNPRKGAHVARLLALSAADGGGEKE